jgi:hypothetical protein
MPNEGRHFMKFTKKTKVYRDTDGDLLFVWTGQNLPSNPVRGSELQFFRTIWLGESKWLEAGVLFGDVKDYCDPKIEPVWMLLP